ncbi:MAG: bifunctional nicotinamidase/pyrazinamidase [Gemmatimonadales bacterium]|nr:bifunctional nicotinamidase/pyrazinamidase [Thioalkalivibrio sp.]
MTTERTALIVVDLQPDFLTGGPLAVRNGEEILEPLFALIRHGSFDTVVATQDWHPRDHVSFASNHEGAEPFGTKDLYGHEQVLWPDHCVQDTAGARLHPDLPTAPLDALIRKGQDPAVDSYSAFRNNWNRDGERPATGLGAYLKERGIGRVILAGLARDYCVKWSAEDAVAMDFATTVLWELTRPVDPDSDDAVAGALQDRGVDVVDGKGWRP